MLRSRVVDVFSRKHGRHGVTDSRMLRCAECFLCGCVVETKEPSQWHERGGVICGRAGKRFV